MPMLPQPALHPLFEMLGYAGGYWTFRAERARYGDRLSEERRWTVIAAAAVGALLGSRLLGWLEQVPRIGWAWHVLFVPSGGGKTIVGGLLGGWLAVEVTKKMVGVHSRTGDLFAVALCIGIAIGRVGCFFAGLADDTYGNPTTLPWGVDFGDGIRRHPTQMYELVFLLALAAVLHAYAKRSHVEGAMFRWFMAAYLGWRMVVEFLKPEPVVAGLDVIQWAAVVGFLALAWGELRVRWRQR